MGDMLSTPTTPGLIKLAADSIVESVQSAARMIVSTMETTRHGCALYLVCAQTKAELRTANPLRHQIFSVRNTNNTGVEVSFNAQEKVFRAAISHSNGLSSSLRIDRKPELGRWGGGIVFYDPTTRLWWGIGISGFSEWTDEALAIAACRKAGILPHFQTFVSLTEPIFGEEQGCKKVKMQTYAELVDKLLAHILQ